jgi:hypothetical protein
MLRALLSLIAGFLVGLVTELETGKHLLAVLCGTVVALLTGLVSLSAFAKNTLDTIKTFYEVQLKKGEWERQKRRITLPNKRDIEKFRTPYRVLERDLLACYTKERQILEEKQFVVGSEEGSREGTDRT